jgi:hypothetical protein
VRLIEYTPACFDLVREAAAQIRGNYSLHHRPFVDYYYASWPECKLYLSLSSSARVCGLIGVEKMPFQLDEKPLTLGFGSNFHAFQRGVGGLLFMRWIRSCDLALEYGGTEDAHRIIRQQGWTYFTGIKNYWLNSDYPVHAGEATYRRAAKWLLRHTVPRLLPAYAPRLAETERRKVSVREEFSYSEDLLPVKSLFRFRLAPTVEYLKWRYNLKLSFVTYRLFRILEDDHSVGYVVLNENSRRLLVAQCDAEGEEVLAYGVLHSILQAGEKDAAPRTVMLTCANSRMAEIYMKFGFAAGKNDYPMAIGGSGKAAIPGDTTNWLVNFDWGDNGLLGPFRDQASEPGDHQQ